jgi:ATP-dependent RNA helicase DHX37/DHR1
LHFPFPTSPDNEALRSAEKVLVAISALKPKSSTLSHQTSTGADLQLTDVGDAMLDYPLSPRHARLILAAAELLQQGRFKEKSLLAYAVALAASLSTESPFLASAAAPAAAGTNQHDSSGFSDKVLMNSYYC